MAHDEAAATDVGIERQEICAHHQAPMGRWCQCPFCKSEKRVLLWQSPAPWTDIKHSTECPHVVGVRTDASDYWYVTFEKKTRTKSR